MSELEIPHSCDASQEAIDEIHGHAITEITYWKGRWWALNGEYATSIAHCPFCGVKLEDVADTGKGG